MAAITIPSALGVARHWVVHKNKQPFGKVGPKGWDQAQYWFTLDEAKKILESGEYNGLGFIVAREPGRGDRQILGGDLDNCRDPITGEGSAWALKILEKLNTCSAPSLSGTGYRFFCIGKLPGDLNKVAGNGPDDLSEDTKERIMQAKPGVRAKLEKYGPSETWNGFELYEDGPRHLTVTGYWLEEYPAELQYRQEEVLEIIEPFLPKPTTTTNGDSSSCRFPALNVTQVIDTSGFEQSGDELIGPNPITGSTTGTNLKVNPGKNTWCNFHAGIEKGGDAWVWLACECGAIQWEQAGKGVFKDSSVVRKTFEHAIKKGLFTAEELNYHPIVSEDPQFDELDICDVITHKETNKETGKEYEWKEFKFNHAKAADSIITKLPVVLGLDGSLYYFQGTTWSNQAEAILYNILHRLARKQFTQHQHKEVIAALLNLLTFSKVKLDPDPWLLGVVNGVVDLRTKEFRDYQKEDYISYSINVKYDMLATCPRFIQFLEEVCPRAVDRLTLIDWLTIHAIGKQFPYVLFLLGNGRNGKGVYEKLLLAIYERSAFSFIGLDELQKSVFARANLAGKRGLIVSEAGDENVKGKAVLPTKFLKGSTGDGIIDSDQKNKNRIQFDPIFKSTIDCNDMPTIKDRSRGWEERFCKGDMPYVFVDNPDAKNIFERKKDPRLIDKLTTPEELSGILNLIILRAAEIFKTEAIIRRSGKTTMAEYLMQSNSLRAFLDGFCEYAFEVTAENAATIRDVYPAYERFCLFPPKEKADIRYFGAAVKKFCGGYKPKKIDNVNRYAGFVFYEDEFEKYMKSLSDPLDQSKINQDSITDQSNQSYKHIWISIYHRQSLVEKKKSNFGRFMDSIDQITISKPQSSNQCDLIAIPEERGERLCAKCHKHMGMSAILPGLGEVCLDCLEDE